MKGGGGGGGGGKRESERKLQHWCISKLITLV